MWQPIETAPKDGTEIILYCVPNEVPTLPVHIANGFYQKSNGLLKPGFWRLCHAVGPSFTPTHWQLSTEPKE